MGCFRNDWIGFASDLHDEPASPIHPSPRSIDILEQHIDCLDGIGETRKREGGSAVRVFPKVLTAVGALRPD